MSGDGRESKKERQRVTHSHTLSITLIHTHTHKLSHSHTDSEVPCWRDLVTHACRSENTLSSENWAKTEDRSSGTNPTAAGDLLQTGPLQHVKLDERIYAPSIFNIHSFHPSIRASLPPLLSSGVKDTELRVPQCSAWLPYVSLGEAWCSPPLSCTLTRSWMSPLSAEALGIYKHSLGSLGRGSKGECQKGWEGIELPIPFILIHLIIHRHQGLTTPVLDFYSVCLSVFWGFLVSHSVMDAIFRNQVMEFL